MAGERYTPFPEGKDIMMAEKIARSLLSSELPREVVRFTLEGEVRIGLIFKDCVGQAIIVSDEHIISISDEYSGFSFMRRVMPLSNN